MKPGTFVELPDGRVGTVVYHNLDGYGIKLGRHNLSESDVNGLLRGNASEGLAPDAMLRDPYPSAELECVGESYKILESA